MELPGNVQCSNALYWAYQYNDTVAKSKFTIHDTFQQYYTAKAHFNWDKNVRITPWQIMLGAMDPTFCCLVSLGIWLEFYY
jgi:hypothetical protein